MKKTIFTTLAIAVISLTSYTASAQKIVSSKTHFKFFSSTPAEDIQANNYKAIGTIDTSTGVIVFSVPMQSFEFEKALMQEHFNSKKFLDTQTNPKAKLVGKIADLSKVDFTKDGSYAVDVIGKLTINGVTNTITEKATITLAEGQVSLLSKFDLTLADYKIAFKNGKPSTNIAKSIEISVAANY